ncbi:MAG: PIN domain-containing protein [Candidatus Methanoperedens sp.]|nr:PIN domain-containing protein [Candidatus Methanoperedens sp.]
MDNIKKILVDSNIFIFANIKEYPEYPAAKAKIKELIKTHELLVNTIIISEIQYKLYRLLDQEESHNRTLKILNSKHVGYESITKSTISKALELSLYSNTRINDAIIAQNAIDLDVEVFTDNIKDFRKISNLKIIPLR